MSDRATTETPADGNVLAVAIAGLLAAAVLYLIHEPSKGSDSWGTWFFARMIWEQGEFPVMGRSPFYTLITAAFWPFGYPLGPALMRIVDACFLFTGVYALCRCYMSRRLGVVVALIWLPGLLALENIVKGHSVAAFCIAMAFRHGPHSAARMAYAYAFLIMAMMFRTNYAVLLAFFAFYDGFRLWLAAKKGNMRLDFRPPKQAWLIVALFALMATFAVLKSDHRWNNGYFNDAHWLGVHDPSVSSAAMIGSFVHEVIVSKYNSDFDSHDIYFVAKNDLPEFKSITDVFKYPDVLTGRIVSNFQIISTVTRMTDIGEAMFRLANRIGTHLMAYPVFYGLVLFGLWHFWRTYVRTEAQRPFLETLAASLVVTGPLLIAWPSGTYLFHFVPVLAFAAIGLGSRAVTRPSPTGPASLLRPFAILLALVLFSNLSTRIAYALDDVWNPANWQRPHVVKEVLDGNFRKIDELTRDCRGLMVTSNHTVLAAFSDRPVSKFYSIFEIPPFGRYGESEYDGLHPDRVDCILVDRESVQRNMNTFTTKWSRYEHYIAPYVADLEAMGAMTIHFGSKDRFALTVLSTP